jgi:hypothetical protein
MSIFCDSLYSVFILSAILGLDFLGLALSRPQVPALLDRLCVRPLSRVRQRAAGGRKSEQEAFYSRLLYYHRNVWANLHILGQPNTFLAQGACQIEKVHL